MADVQIVFKGDARDVKEAITGIRRDIGGLEKDTGAAGQEMGQLGALGSKTGALIKAGIAVAATGAVVDFAKGAAAAYSDLEESVNAVNVQFGTGADAILKFGEGAADAVGLANSEFNQLATVTGATLGAFIDDEQAIASETIKLTERAADMASVFNTDVDQAMTALGAALRGESEPIRRFGVQLDDASVKAKAVAMGLAATTGEVTLQDKGMARLALIYEQTNKVSGDFANTSDSLANRQKILTAKWQDAQAMIGEKLVPAFELLTDTLITVLDHLEDFATFIGGTLGDRIDPAARSIEAMNELIAEGATEAEAWAQVMGGRFTPTAEDVTAALDDAIRAAQAQAREMRTLGNDSIHASDGLRQVAEATKLSADEMRKATDPAFALRKANEEYKEAQQAVAALQASGRTNTAEYQDAVAGLLEEQADLNYATAQYEEAGGAAAEGLFELGEQARITREEVEALIFAMENLNRTPISIDAQVDLSEVYRDLEIFKSGARRPL